MAKPTHLDRVVEMEPREGRAGETASHVNHVNPALMVAQTDAVKVLRDLLVVQMPMETVNQRTKVTASLSNPARARMRIPS
jgi:hypothetical protein